MRYSRVLTVLALVGVVALATALLTHGARSAPKPARAATTTPAPQSQLHQLLQQLQLRLLTRQPRTQAQAPSATVNPPFNAAPCPVAGGCSIKPCVQFVQGASQPVASTVQGAVAVPTLPGGPRTQRCTRRQAAPQTLRVMSAVAAPPSVSVSAPQSASGRSF